MKAKSLLSYSLALAVVCGLGCKSAQVTGQRDFAPPGAAKPIMVYIADFELGAQEIKHEDGVLSGRAGPVGRVGERLGGSSGDPTTRARQLVELMSNSLVKELSKSGFTAIRFATGMSMPVEGWLVRGIFTEVQEGNRVRRAVIGFGQGQTDIQVITTVHNLSKGPPQPLYEVATDAASGSGPGAAPTLVLGPYGAAARFVMAGKDLDKNVKQTAAQIAEQMARRVQQGN